MYEFKIFSTLKASIKCFLAIAALLFVKRERMLATVCRDANSDDALNAEVTEWQAF